MLKHFYHKQCCFLISLTFYPYQITRRTESSMWETWVGSLGWQDPLEESMATNSVFLPGESPGQRSLAAYSPWGRKESDMTERLSTAQHGLVTARNRHIYSMVPDLCKPMCSYFLNFFYLLDIMFVVKEKKISERQSLYSRYL